MNVTWDLVPLPPDAHTIGCKWPFKIKKKTNDSIQRYKARLVTKRYNKKEGLNYFDTFSPMIKPTTIKIVLTIALQQLAYASIECK
jgi:Reverse transcriptase (RNA-dependent DNA polymerase)